MVRITDKPVRPGGFRGVYIDPDELDRMNGSGEYAIALAAAVNMAVNAVMLRMDVVFIARHPLQWQRVKLECQRLNADVIMDLSTGSR